MPRMGLAGPAGEARTSWVPSDHGYLAWTVAPNLPAAGSAMPTAGLVSFAKLRLLQASSVTNVVMYCSSVGVTLTAGQCFASLHTGAGALIGQTADQAASWVSTGLKTMALAGGPFSLAAGSYYVTFWFNGTTGPTWARAGAVALGLTNANLSSPNLIMGTADAGVTTTAPANLGAQTGVSTVWWAALS